MPVLRSIRERLAAERPLGGLRIGACLHVTAETACLMQALAAGGAEVALCAANPLTTQDEVAAALRDDGCATHGRRGEDADAYVEGIVAVVDERPQVTLDDGADLLTFIHAGRTELLPGLVGGTEETTTGLVRLRALELACPSSRSTRRARSASSTTTTARASRRSTASCARPTCCSRARRSSSSATAGRARASRSAPAARARR